MDIMQSLYMTSSLNKDYPMRKVQRAAHLPWSLSTGL